MTKCKKKKNKDLLHTNKIMAWNKCQRISEKKINDKGNISVIPLNSMKTNNGLREFWRLLD